MSSLIGQIRTIGAATIAIAILVVVLGSVFGTATGVVGTGEVEYLEPAPATATGVDGVEAGSTVRATTGTAIALTGQGAYIDDPTADRVFETGSWAIATTVDADESVVDSQDTRVVYAQNNESVLLLYERGNWTLRVENATGATAYAEAPATRDREELGAQYNATAGEVELYVDGSLADTAAFTAASEPRDPAAAWIGTVDEVRAWNASLGASDHAAYASQPVRPVATDTAALRLMFNDGQPLVAYYAAGDAAAVGDADLAAGVSGPGLTAGTDYAVDSGNNTIRTLDGGFVDDAPVLIVGGGGAFAALLTRLQTIGSTALGLLVVGLLVGAAGWLNEQLGGF